MNGARVRVLDNFSSGARANLPFAARYRRQLEVVRGDIRNLPTVLRAARGAQVIFHRAAMRSVPRSVKDPLGANDNNVTGTLNVLEAARRCRVPRVVYASSSSVYGDRPDLPKREDQPMAPLSPYAASKAAGEQYAIVWTRLYGVETAGLRYFNVFGPRQDPKSEYAAVLPRRSEEHTSELQSPCNLVCRLLLEKKKNYLYWTVIAEKTRRTYFIQSCSEPSRIEDVLHGNGDVNPIE